jgi:cytochrome c peroxidase
MYVMQWFTVLFIAAGVTLYADAIKPIPLKVNVHPEKVVLGKALFFDTILSKDNTISCATCHDLQNGGDDGLQYSFGINGQKGYINTPTVYNAVFNFRQFWDGHAKDLKEQALGPIRNPVEMGQDLNGLVSKLNQHSGYKKQFMELYPDGVTQENIADALAEYEKTLITPNAPFDRYLRGEEDAISDEAKVGYHLFKFKGCIICHNGVNVGGNLYNKFGIYKDANSTNLGRYNVTGRDADKFVFKVPSLRNVALTAPYMHDGRIKTLHDAVEFMTQYQLGRYMKEEEIRAIEAFLKTLTGEIPKSAWRKP